jgi:hypothetical protein
MARRKYYDFGIRPKGSPEFACDPFVLMQILEQHPDSDPEEHAERHRRAIEVFNFLVKTALTILPPKQREIFYSIWIRSGGKMSKGVMDYSRRIGQSHYSNYNSAYKAYSSLQSYLKRTGYDVYILEYLRGDRDTIE